MGPLSWSADVVTGLQWRQRVVAWRDSRIGLRVRRRTGEGIRLYAGPDRAVAERSGLAFHAAYEFAGAAIGAALIVSVARFKSR